MQFKSICLIAVLLLVAGCTSPEAADSTTADPLTGRWSGDYGSGDRRMPVELDLKWDGSKLEGTVNPGREDLPLMNSAFDSATSVIKIEFDARSSGRPVHFAIDGKVEGDAIMGTWNRGDQQGDFKVTKDK